MTVSDPGAGQQQGRECYADQLRTGAVDPYCPEHGHLSTAYSSCSCLAPSPTPPARDSGRNEAREAVARWLWEREWYHEWTASQRRQLLNEADELLALPELDKLLRRPA